MIAARSLLFGAAVAALLSVPVLSQPTPIPGGGSSSGEPTGPAGGDLTGDYPNPALATVNPDPGTYGDAATCIDGLTVNAKGLITAISETACDAGAGDITEVTAGAGLTGGGTTGAVTLSALAAINAQTGTSYTIDATDAAKLVTFSNGSPIAVTLPQATGSFGTGFGFGVQNKGAGAVTITPTTSTINGAASIVIPQDQGCWITSDGTNYQVDSCNAIITIPIATRVSGLGTGVATLLGGNSSGTGGPAGTASPTFTGTLTASAITFTGTMTTNLTGGGTQCVQVNNSGVLSGTGSGCGGSGSPGGSDTQMQFNNAGSFGGLSQFTTTTGGVLTLSTAGAASTAAMTFSGAPSTAGTTTTDFPLLSLWTSGASGPTTWSTDGTFIGVNAASGFAGRYIDFHLNGAASAFYVDSSGTINAAGQLNLSINSATTVAITRNGSNRLVFDATGTQFTNTMYSSNASGSQIASGAASSTVPTLIPNRASSTTGWGAQASGNMSGIVAGTETVRLDAAKLLLIGSTTKMNWPQITPSSSTDTCTTGDIEADANYIYVCTASNTWKRATLSAF